MPHARHTDPNTSHEAAASISIGQLTATKRAILAILNVPLTDQQLEEVYALAVTATAAPYASPSSIRTRRNELFRQGLIEPIGYGKTTSKRRAIIWQTTKKDNA